MGRFISFTHFRTPFTPLPFIPSPIHPLPHSPSYPLIQPPAHLLIAHLTLPLPFSKGQRDGGSAGKGRCHQACVHPAEWKERTDSLSARSLTIPRLPRRASEAGLQRWALLSLCGLLPLAGAQGAQSKVGLPSGAGMVKRVEVASRRGPLLSLASWACGP